MTHFVSNGMQKLSSNHFQADGDIRIAAATEWWWSLSGHTHLVLLNQLLLELDAILAAVERGRQDDLFHVDWDMWPYLLTFKTYLDVPISPIQYCPCHMPQLVISPGSLVLWIAIDAWMLLTRWWKDNQAVKVLLWLTTCVSVCLRAYLQSHTHDLYQFLCCGYFYLSFFFFFPRLISAVGDWMSTILLHMAWP